jgi:hypothetical protein
MNAEILSLLLVSASVVVSPGKIKQWMETHPRWEEAVEKALIGNVPNKSRVITPKERRTIAYHEAGHAVVMNATPHSDPVYKITIIPRGQMGGFTMALPQEDTMLMWGATLAKYSDNIITQAIGRARDEYIDWPPNLPQFHQLCRQIVEEIEDAKKEKEHSDAMQKLYIATISAWKQNDARKDWEERKVNDFIRKMDPEKLAELVEEQRVPMGITEADWPKVKSDSRIRHVHRRIFLSINWSFDANG